MDPDSEYYSLEDQHAGGWAYWVELFDEITGENTWDTLPVMKDILTYYVMARKANNMTVHYADQHTPTWWMIMKWPVALFEYHNNNGVGQYITNRMLDQVNTFQSTWAREIMDWERIIWYEPSKPEFERSTFPTAKWFVGDNAKHDFGAVLLRDKWSTSDNTFSGDTKIFFRSGDHFTGKSHFHANHFGIYKYGDLAIKDGADEWIGGRMDSHYAAYGQSSVSANTITVFDPTVMLDEGQEYILNRGSRSNGPRSHTLGALPVDVQGANTDLSDHTDNSWVDTGDITHFETTQDYDYVVGDASNAYRFGGGNNPGADLEQLRLDVFQRELAFLNKKYLVVFDRVRSINPNFIKRWYLHTVLEPEMSGSQIDYQATWNRPYSLDTMGGATEWTGKDMSVRSSTSGWTTPGQGKLFLKMLLPSDGLFRKRGGSSNPNAQVSDVNFFEFSSWRNDQNHDYTGHIENNSESLNIRNNPTYEGRGRWRIEEETSGRLYDNFLNVLYPTEAATLSMPETVNVTASGNTMTGAHIKDSAKNLVALFSTDPKGAASQADISYQITRTAPTQHMLFNLTPNSYYNINVTLSGSGESVVVTSSIVATSYQASAQGVLTFDDQDAQPASDTQAPTIPTTLTATAVSSSQINLSWNASTDDVGVAGYKIYRCSGTGCTPTVQITTSATNSYSDIGLTASTTYTYTVSAYDAAGNESGKSNSKSATTQSPSATTANYPLEIIQPQPNMDTKNRFYKAYPGLEYNVRMAVIGGAYPFVHELTSAPSGMTINRNTGEISWPNPTTTGSPHSVSVRVTDQDGSVATVSWTVTVTANGFRFIDAVNGKTAAEGGTGTQTNPWKTLRDMYEGNDYASKNKRSYADEFLYFRNGTYFIDTYLEDNGSRTPFVGYNKPIVWLAYPDESPLVDFQNGASIIFYSGTDNLYIDGIAFKNMSSYGIQTESNGRNQVFRRLKMDRLGPTQGFNNQSFLRILAAGMGDYMVIQDSIFNDLDHGAAIKIYQTNKMLIEDNIISNIKDTLGTSAIEGIALKQDVVRPTVRHNTIFNVTERGIGGNMNSQTIKTEGFEILYNLVYNAANNAIIINNDGNAGDIYVYLNTFVGRVIIRNTDSLDGPFHFSNNVIINADPGNHLYYDGVTDSSRILLVDNLSGYPADNIVDAGGNLTYGYQSYVGTHGYQLSAVSPPEPFCPGGVSVDPDVLFCDDFEGVLLDNSNPGQWNYIGTLQSTSPDGEGFNGGHALKTDYQYIGREGTPEFTATINLIKTNENRNPIYIRWDQKWSDNWVWPSSQQKFFLLTNNLRQDYEFSIVNGRNQLSFIYLDMNTNKQTYINPSWHGYSPNRRDDLDSTNHPDSDNTCNIYGDSCGGVKFQKNKWYSLEMAVYKDSNKGWAKYWIDGKLAFSAENLNTSFSNPGNFDLLHVQLLYQPRDQQHPEMFTWMDNVVVSTEYIGPIGAPDTQAPAVPVSLTAVAVSSSQITISWNASTDDVGVAGYKIYRCAGSTCSPTTQIATSTTDSYTDTGLNTSTAYTYVVSAYDVARNESALSQPVSATTQASPPLKGDVNCDTQVDVLDIQALVNHILGIQDLGASADVNKDGSVDVLDAQSVVNIILGT